MTLLFASESDDPVAWGHALARLLPDLDMRVWPEVGDVADIDVALVWAPPVGMLRGLPNLRLIQSLGMGVDHIFRDPDLPPAVPVARMVDPNMAGQMSEYAALAVLRHHRHADAYDAQQRTGRWDHLPLPDTEKTTVGIMGLGVLGGDVARTLKALGFPVAGWSRNPKRIDGIDGFHGRDGLAPFLARSHFLICLLPLTPETENIIDARLLAALPAGAYVINIARGRHLVEEDLLAALERGHIAGAALDVFRTEPLPPDHPFRSHPRIHATPHVAALTNPRTAAAQVAENITRLRAGHPILNLVDRRKGY